MCSLIGITGNNYIQFEMDSSRGLLGPFEDGVSVQRDVCLGFGPAERHRVS